MTLLVPALATASSVSWSCSLGSPMVRRPRTSSIGMVPDSRTLISIGGCSVISTSLEIFIHAAATSPVWPKPRERPDYGRDALYDGSAGRQELPLKELVGVKFGCGCGTRE